MDTWDHKPALSRWDGKSIQEFDSGFKNTTGYFKNSVGKLMQSPFSFFPRGQSGKMVSSIFPQLGSHVDKMAFIHSGFTESNNHSPALFMMNSGLVSDSAQQWASDLLAHDTWNDPQRIEALYKTALGRPPTEHEIEESVKYIQRFIDAASTLEDDSDGNPEKSGKTEKQTRLRAWGSYCRAILASNEFVYIE